MSKNEYLYIDAVRKRPVGRTPIWIMRQAGRYLPEYMEVRRKHDFITVCKTPELAAEVTLQPIRRFGFDAAILFSDILVVPEAMGMKLEFREDHGPRLYPEVRNERDVGNLNSSGVEGELEYVTGAIRFIQGELAGQTPLIGFSGSPFTLATYMVEGSPSRNFKQIKTMMYREPDVLSKLLEKLTEVVTAYLVMQIKTGVDAVQVFDTWGGIVPPHLYEDFSARFMKEIVKALRPYGVPVTLFSKGGIDILRSLADSGADMLGVDWMTDMARAKHAAGTVAALQGNLDPTALYGSRELIRSEVGKILEVFGGESGHVFNLGHGILPDIPVEKVQFLVEEVRTRSESLHSRG